MMFSEYFIFVVFDTNYYYLVWLLFMAFFRRIWKSG